MKTQLIYTFLFCSLLIGCKNDDDKINNFTEKEPELAWEKTLGGSLNEHLYVLQQTSDGGYIAGGSSESSDGDVTANYGKKDIWLVKLDAQGNTQWQKNYGGTNQDVVHHLQQTPDGGYILGGFSSSNDNDVTVNHGMRDYWIVKLNASGNILWRKTFGGSKDDIIEAIEITRDGGYIAVGFTNSNTIGNYYQGWAIKLNANGDKQWEVKLGSDERDIFKDVKQVDDNSYVLTGYTSTASAQRQLWVVKITQDGDEIIEDFNKNYGGAQNDYGNAIEQALDGGYIIAGTTKITDTNDAWLIKLNSDGEKEWSKAYGGTESDYFHDIQKHSNGGYLVIGGSSSTDNDVENNNGAFDIWAVRLDDSGTILWKKNKGETGNDYGRSIQQTLDGGFVVGGTITHVKGEGEGITKQKDYWIVKYK